MAKVRKDEDDRRMVSTFWCEVCRKYEQNVNRGISLGNLSRALPTIRQAAPHSSLMLIAGSMRLLYGALQ